MDYEDVNWIELRIECSTGVWILLAVISFPYVFIIYEHKLQPLDDAHIFTDFTQTSIHMPLHLLGLRTCFCAFLVNFKNLLVA